MSKKENCFACPHENRRTTINFTLGRAHTAQALRSAAQQFHRGQKQDRDDDQNRRNSQDSGRNLLTNAAEHLPRDRTLAHIRQLQHRHDLVKARDKGKKRPGNDPRQNQWHLHLEEGTDRPRPHIRAGPGQGLIKARQGGRHRDDHKWCAQSRMSQNDAKIGLRQADTREKEKQTRGGDHQGHNHR